MTQEYSWKPRCILVLLMLVLPLGACTPEPDLENSIPVPEKVFDVTKRPLKSESAYQIDFNLKARYPNTEAISFYSDAFTKNGWSVCAGNNAWTEYDKQEDDKKSTIPIRQKLEYFVSDKVKRLLLVALRYFGERRSDTKQPRKWNNEIQHVTVVMYDLREDFNKTLSLLSLSCKQ